MIIIFRWFKSWQEMLNAGVQSAFQEFANTYSHSLTIPTEMVLHNTTFISYKVTNLIWSEHFVAFEATSTFKALINGRNETYIPDEEKNLTERLTAATSSIPIGQWAESSASDRSSHLLQGIRLSGYFLNAMMWYANRTRATEYHGNTTVLDSQLNGTINYAPPFLSVTEAGVLNISIARGELLANCTPTNGEQSQAQPLFDVKFESLMGAGRIKVVPADNRTCVTGEIVELDLSKLKTTPFKPKLPLPRSFESELMKTGIRQLEPLINQYLLSRPLCLPQDIEPLVAYPEVFLNQTKDGLGYMQILSYCTCSDFQAPGSFSKCDDRSRLCEFQANSRGKRSSPQEDLSGLISRSGTEMEPNPNILEEGDNSELPEFVKFLNKSQTFNKVTDWLNEKVEDWIFDEKNETELAEDDDVMINWADEGTTFVADPREILLIHFETSTDCSLQKPGDNAKVYRLTPKSYCSPITVGGSERPTEQYYVFKPDGSSINFGCSKHCKGCLFQDVKIAKKDVCIARPNNGMSFVATRNPNYINKQLLKTNGTSAISFFFNHRDACKLVPSRERTAVSGEMVSSTYQLGKENKGCVKMISGAGFLELTSLSVSDHTSPQVSLKLECSANFSLTGDTKCAHCAHRFQTPGQGECSAAPRDDTTLIKYSKSLTLPDTQKHTQEALDVEDNTKLMIVLAIILSASLVILVLTLAACVWCFQNGKGGNRRISKYWEKLKESLSNIRKLLSAHLGIRFLTWKTLEKSNIFEDVVHNIFLLTNGICAILFAFEWNSPNNPLLLFHTKISSKMGFGYKILDVTPIEIFTGKLNFWTYIVNIVNGAVAFAIILLWCCTKSGSRQGWTKLRLASAISMLASILLTIACVVFTTYFDELVTLNSDTGFFITDNPDMQRISRRVVQTSMNGLSLTVVSFTIVFLFHGVGGGLYSGTVLFRILHLYSRKENLEILTTLLVILTIIQPFICLHPVIIWSQDSNHNSLYLILTIFIWFLPLLVHLCMKLILAVINNKYKNKKSANKEPESIPLNTKRANSKYPEGLVSNRKEEVAQTGTSKKLMTIIDVTLQVTQLVIFLTTFGFITHYIIYTELVEKKQNLKNFVLPAIISVFLWMMSISYYSLDLVLNATNEETSLVFQDNAKRQLQASLKKRLAVMEKRSTLGRVRNRVERPNRPPPPPPQPKSEQMAPTKDLPGKGKTLPPLVVKSKNQIEPTVVSAGASIRIKIKEPNGTSMDVIKSNLDMNRTVGSVDFEYMEAYWNNSSCFRKVTNFILESQEYKYPKTHQWRIKFRRICLILGVLGFTYTTADTILSTQNFSSKAEIQKIINLVGTNLTWPAEGSALDKVFELYNTTQQSKGYVMIAASLLFWLSLAMDWTSYWMKDEKRSVKSLCILASRILSFLGSLLVFASVIQVSLPNYLKEAELDTICQCGEDFNDMVRQVAEFSIGLVFACLFTFQLLPVLMTIAPALVRASILILFHPEFQKEDQTTALQMRILQQVTIFSSLLSFPITFVSMCILDQHQKSLVISILIIMFWVLPPLVLYVGLTIAKRLKKNGRLFLLFVYYTYNFVYLSLVISLVAVSFGGNFQKFIQIVRDLLLEPAVWFGTMAQVFLCNVVISDLLYMTVF